MNHESSMLGWHFVQKDGRLRDHIDGHKSAHCGVKVYPGLTLKVDGTPQCNQWGLHAAPMAASACFHAPSLLACRVELSGQMAMRPGEAAATQRTVLWMADATVPFWVWTCRRVAREMTRVRSEGVALAPSFDALILAKFREVQGRGARADFEAARGPARRAGRDLCGLDSRGKATRQATPWAYFGWMMLGIAGEQPRSVTPRLRNYFMQGQGADEAREFEQMMLAMGPK